MIKKVVIRRFKRFQDTTFEFPEHVVIVGPNNTGKTTVLQAIAAWAFSLNQWRLQNEFNRRNGYKQKEIVLPNFAVVSLLDFDWLWHNREYRSTVEIEVHHSEGWVLTMELIADSPQQIYVRPKSDVDPNVARNAVLDVVFVPAMTSLSTDEEVHTAPRLEYLLGHGKPGEVLRNLIVAAHRSGETWASLTESIRRLFGFELIPPDSSEHRIISQYRMSPGGKLFDIASAGSGFQQVLMLLTFLNTRKGAVLLLDEPDAHLHILLQDLIYQELRQVAERTHSQLIIATHSEVMIDAVEPRDLCVLLDRPIRITTEQERSIVLDTVRVLSNTDIMLALDAPGVLYVEGRTDLEILKEWARILKHPLFSYLSSPKLLWKPKVADQRLKGSGVKSTEHFDAIRLVKLGLSALELVDGDANPGIQSTVISGEAYQRLRWNRYEIESYLLHAGSIQRFVSKMTGTALDGPNAQDVQHYFEQNYPPSFLANPFEDLAFIKNTKARTDLIPPVLTAGGLPNFPYTRYHEIAAVMLPDEIHPEVKEKLDLIQKAFRL